MNHQKPLVQTMQTLLNSVQEKDHCLLVGLTGTIASGKSTVAEMLSHCGAYSIDFDLLSRQVVKPGQLAYKQIVDFFGPQILQPDTTLDRQKLSNVVFKDAEKRKKLEQFTHPQIAQLFVYQLKDIIQQDPNGIIQVIIPLLIEHHLQHLFHKLLVVYTSPETLMKRLILRNHIHQDKALQMINSQISIDKKLDYADFVIYNDKDRDDTHKQVIELWDTLKTIQKSQFQCS
jgi:dephospho-CoA kinase